FVIVSLEMPDERRLGNERCAGELGQQIVFESVFEIPLLALGRIELADEAHAQLRREHGLRAHHVLEPRHAELERVEELLVGPEADGRAGVALADLSDDFQFLFFLSAGEPHRVLVAVAAHPHLQFPREQCDSSRTRILTGKNDGSVSPIDRGLDMNRFRASLCIAVLSSAVHAAAATNRAATPPQPLIVITSEIVIASDTPAATGTITLQNNSKKDITPQLTIGPFF